MTRKPGRTERAVKGTLTSFLQYGLQMLLQAFLAPLVLKLAGQETLGAYALLMQVVGYLAMLDLGFSLTLTRFLANAHGYDDEGVRFRNVMSTARTFLLGSNCLNALLTLVVGWKIESLFAMTHGNAEQARFGLCLLAAWVVARTPWTVYGIGLNATQDMAAYNFIGIIGNAFRLVLSLALVFSGAGLVGLMAANVLAEMLSTLLSALRFRRLHPHLRPVWGVPDRALFREMLGFSVQAFLMHITWRLVYYTDNIVIGWLFGAAAVSIYYTTQMPATLCFNMANRISDSASPAINELSALQEKGRLAEIFLRLHRFTFLMVLPLAGGIMLLNGRLIALWVGRAQYAGELMTAALAAFTILISVSHVSLIFAYASGEIRALSVISLCEGIANLCLSLWLGRKIGLAGVMIATVIANIPTTLYLVAATMRSLKIDVPTYLKNCSAPGIVPAAAGYGAAVLAGRWLPFEGWVSFGVRGITLVSVYVLALYCLGLSKEERGWLSGRLLRLVRPAAGAAEI